MLTPQSIKDQEFQTKFRGYEPIEVRAYLELLAEDFFELTEQNRLQAEEIESLLAEQESLQKSRDTLAAEVKISQENVEGIQEETQDGYKQKDQEIAELTEKLASVSASLADREEQNVGLQEQIEIEKLRGRIELLEEQNRELKQEGVDFKTTILTAQKFADELRRTSQEDAKKIMAEARAEIDRFRMEAEAELARLPLEIEELHQLKIKVRKDLETTLYTYLEALESPDAPLVTANDDKEDDLADLFQSIQLPDDDDVGQDDAQDDIEQLNRDPS
jgi:DivIVA domain-containing protein